MLKKQAKREVIMRYPSHEKCVVTHVFSSLINSTTLQLYSNRKSVLLHLGKKYSKWNLDYRCQSRENLFIFQIYPSELRRKIESTFGMKTDQYMLFYMRGKHKSMIPNLYQLVVIDLIWFNKSTINPTKLKYLAMHLSQRIYIKTIH